MIIRWGAAKQSDPSLVLLLEFQKKNSNKTWSLIFNWSFIWIFFDLHLYPNHILKNLIRNNTLLKYVLCIMAC